METVTNWERLMAEVVAEAERGDYVPGSMMAPGDGSDSIDPLDPPAGGQGTLLYVITESLHAALVRGVDRDAAMQMMATAANVDVPMIQSVFTGDVKCPTTDVLRGIGAVLEIDLDFLVDVAQRGGCDYPDFSTRTTSY